LLVCTALILISIEGAARFGLERVSRIHRRIMQETAEARNHTQPSVNGRQTVLLLGNSLLLEGIDVDLFNSLQSRYEAQRYTVEQTFYLDWFYAMRRLFRHGTRASMAVLCLNAPQFIAPSIRGDYSANVLFDMQDIWPASRDSDATLTKTSGYYLAHYSLFYAMRGELRSVLMFRIAPPVVAMWHQAVTRPGVIPPDDQMIPIMAARLRKLRELCASYGAEFVFLVPPDRQRGDIAMLRAGEQSGVRVLRPIPNISLPLDFYQEDGFHLNSKGATLFTTGTVNELLK
jgi:hypothetical protein